MQLTVSGVKKEYEEGITLPKLFEIENVETPEYVTVSINEEFIPGDQKETYQLKMVIMLNSYTLWVADRDNYNSVINYNVTR